MVFWLVLPRGNKKGCDWSKVVGISTVCTYWQNTAVLPLIKTCHFQPHNAINMPTSQQYNYRLQSVLTGNPP